MTTSGKQQEHKPSSTSSSDCWTGINPASVAAVTSADISGIADILKPLLHSRNYVSTRAMLSGRGAIVIDHMRDDRETKQQLQTAFNEALLSGSAMLIFSGSGATTPPSITHVPNWQKCDPCLPKNLVG